MILLADSGFHHWLVRWASLADWAVAIGTLALALATAWLGLQARREAGEVQKQADAVTAEAAAVNKQADAVTEQVTIGRQQLEAGRRQLEASQRPFVLPTTSGWRPSMFFPVEPEFPHVLGEHPEPWIMLSNPGAGPAYNADGALFWPGGIGGGWLVVQTSLAAGQHLPVLLENHPGYEVKWAQTTGYLRYTDLAGTEWQTHFTYHQNVSGQWSVTVRAVGKTEDLGEPNYTLEDGWKNAP